MTYVGAVPTTGDFKKLDSITTSSATTFNLRQGGVAVYPQSANHCIVSLNGVIQAPGDAFNIVNDTVVFSSSLASTDVINFFLVLGNVNDIGVVSDDTVSTAKIQANAVTSAKIASGVIPSLRPNVKPLIINGNMAVAQRGTSFSHADSNNDAYPVDRFSFVLGSIGAYTSTQETLSSGAAYDAGFRKAARIDCTTAQSSPAAGDYFWFQYKMEAQDCLLFKKGTSSAEKMTVAFWVKSNKTGTSQLTVKDGDNDRICAGTYAISSANTWEHKVINIAADTTGAFNNDNGAGFIFEWWLGAGSTYSSGAAPTAWEARADGDRGVSNLSINDNTANDWAITGIQVEVGEYTSSTLPPFQHESYGDNLNRCLRYYYRNNGRSGFGAGTGFVQDGTVKAYIYHTMPVAPRTEMSFSLSGTSAAILSIDGNAGDDVQSIGATHSDSFPYKDYEFNFVTDGSSITDKAGMGIRINASNYIEGSAEL